MIAHESGATDTVDPFAGSYYVESLTAEIEQRAWALIEKIDEQGGSVKAIAFIKNEIEESAFGYHERYRTKQDIVVGVNEYVEDEAEVEEILSVDPESEREQLERLAAFSAADEELPTAALGELRDGARGEENLLPPIREALRRAPGRRGVRRAARRVRQPPAALTRPRHRAGNPGRNRGAEGQYRSDGSRRGSADARQVGAGALGGAERGGRARTAAGRSVRRDRDHAPRTRVVHRVGVRSRHAASSSWPRPAAGRTCASRRRSPSPSRPSPSPRRAHRARAASSGGCGAGAPSAPPLVAPEPQAPPIAPERATGALTSLLDEVGGARHRPFSRDAGGRAHPVGSGRR